MKIPTLKDVLADPSLHLKVSDLATTEAPSIYVLNNTSPPGNICFSAHDGIKTITVTIPVTSIPFDLTTILAKNFLINNTDLRKLILGNKIVLISEELADKMMQAPEAIEEATRIYSGAVPRDLNVPKEVQSSKDLDSGVSGFALSLSVSTATENAILAQVKARAGSLPKEDVRYIMDNVPHSKVKEYCATLLV